MLGMESREALDGLRAAAVAAGLNPSEIVLPAVRDVTANGLRLNYLDWGGSARRTMVLLHGGALTAHTWDLVCLASRDEWRCVAPDLRGHGDSAWSHDGQYALADYTSDLAALADGAGLDRFVLVGMSLGGLVSMLYAAEHPRRVAALVLVDVGPEMSGPGAARLRNFTDAPAELESIEAFVERAIRFNPRRRPELLRRSLLHNLRPTHDGKWTWKYDPRRSANIGSDPGRRPGVLWAAVARVTCPTLVVRGSESDLFLDADARRLLDALPRATYVCIEGAGHTVQGDQPAALALAVREFLMAQDSIKHRAN